jgi:hypothetical protein
MSDQIKVMHLSYVLRDDEDPELGDKVITLCGLVRKLKKPNTKPVCGECFKIFSEDAARTGDALEVALQTIEGTVEVMNVGRQAYMQAVGEGDHHILTGSIVTPKEKRGA